MNHPVLPERTLEETANRYLGYAFKALYRQAQTQGVPHSEVKTAIAAAVIAYLAWEPEPGGQKP